MNVIFETLKNINTTYKHILEHCIFDVDLSNYVTFRTSGNASCLYEPENISDLKYFISFLKDNEIDFFVLGKGSNLLVSEKGFDGVVIKIGKNFNDFKIAKSENENYELYCQSGAMLSFVSNQSFKESLTGLEPLSLIPGTIGGAVYMNAGAYGKEMKDILKTVEVFNTETLEVQNFSTEMCEFSYRKSIFMNDKYIILSCVFILHKGDKDEILALVEQLRNKRKSSQPLDKPNAGSTFKRPLNDFAGRLIDESGLKGFSVGDASVSEKHAGFVINKGNAKPDDIISLIEKVKTIVLEKHGVLLEEELKIINK